MNRLFTHACRMMRTALSPRRATLLLLSLLPFTTAVAQTLEEVVVTATRREESIQDVPVSVVAFTGATIEKVGITDVADLTAYVPNFEFASNSIQTNLFIRGIGSGPTHAIEQSVGRFVDDVYIGRADMNLNGFMDVAAVEVLRGPQGTLFGKNTVAGAIVIRTADPTEEFEGGFTGTLGTYSSVNNYKELDAYLSGPLADNLRGRVAIRYLDDGGYVENVLPGPDGVERRMLGARLKLDWDIGDQTTVRLKGDFHNLDADGQPLGEDTIPASNPRFLDFVPASVLGPNWQYGIDCEASPVVDLGGGNTVDTGQFCPFKTQDTYTLAMTIDHVIDGVGTFKSITAQQHYSWEEQFVSVDNGVSGGTFRAERAEQYDGFSQEFRFTSEPNENFDYIAGLYYEDSEVDRFQRSNFNFLTFLGGGPFFTRNQPWQQETETLAVFGQFRYNFNDEVSLTVGGRYSDETKDYQYDQFWNEYRSQVVFVGPPVIDIDDSRSETEFSPSLQLSWDLSDDVMLFASASEGYKSGGFSDRIESPSAPISYGAETNNTFELGMKGTFLDGAMNANLTLFNMQIEDMQVAAIVPGSAGDFTVTNAAEATSEGLEVEVDWQLSDSTVIGGNLAFTDAVYDAFGGPCPAVPINVLPDGSCSYAGFNLPFAPETKGTFYVDYTATKAIGGWDLNFRGTVGYSDSYFTNSTYEEGEFQDSFTKLDATVSLISSDDRYRWSLTGRNLTEEEIVDWSILVAGTYYAYLKPPREIALTFSANF